MSENKTELSFLPVPGVRLATIGAGIRYQGRDDLLALELAPGATTAAVFTRNAFCAAPVMLARHHLSQTAPRYLLVNSGNANAGTGARGLDDTRACCAALAEAAGCRPEEVLPFSTGVIGEPLPVARFEAAMPALLERFEAAAWPDAARAIMTTDTVPKLCSRTFEIDGRQATITGIAKGAGMICPDMATMLAFIATDAAVAPEVLQGCLKAAADRSFNAISIDGDTSTNDACVLAATGALGNAPIVDETSTDYAALQAAVESVCVELATAIVRDGEGATKLVTVRVEQARDRDEARRVAYTIAHSPLVKTALFASDPNWGRILAAVGRAGVENLVIEDVDIWLGEVRIVEAGGRAADYTEQAGAAVMAESEILIRVALGRGTVDAEVLTCDFSYDYVRINAEYRS
ncbi:bifunctional glutamate N-acetyltransferase/amino-acid acetyltransferase ArgJ [Allochromatium vinosum]|uniref:Arginine biosynthesis bifunctional protein ArgJ n=1 Tax=Allochromatium vinosum (strain ATCC 17899 / DSM 180 / NBRC 103801 / NCIMB 10441 / D) TaxID=572477 RepID=D3RVI6_ALLVD|nr:bifunctional glutamate N-acetyltransferase/amino-acid acetyltransferase ArgJ [Allochromatium vinosum]ADC61113.1 arginine biosynthesis bifunctional protein ArgJ [Allochromatium vinosum DSM 180]